ncbi:PoNe immunity protein domain-containing protein [Paraburkholderia sabiae]|uniref:PoNe immunity protein domain-containing protein n=1 Tax=Paraburkholderia sabiae TaxID=273251 RepID=A0ABU9QL54_9BURK|nr:PoNe immunity protein domain-containing protein [Paraburkholderia sabiae]WJZ77370.1 DUF1911 domain-containing protein [Paraburkholderia sabiae]CAD6547583.1 hypothetical protein LMG24235_04446 [Paraburkholderia sabiae]
MGAIRAAGDGGVFAEQQLSRRSWSTNLDKYIVCFWLTGLALTLSIPDDQWQRLTALMGNEGEDVLLDRIISSRDHGRRIGTVLCHPKPYARLLATVNALPPDQPRMLRSFVENWYAELDRPAKKEGWRQFTTAPIGTDLMNLFRVGRILGSGLSKQWRRSRLLQLDDSLCLGLPHYPGDLLREADPTSLEADELAEPFLEGNRDGRRSLLKRIFGKA